MRGSCFGAMSLSTEQLENFDSVNFTVNTIHQYGLVVGGFV